MNYHRSIYFFILVALTGLSLGTENPDLKMSTYLDRETYITGDTVILALQCKIPKNFHLYGNPLGPGIGKPLSLKVSSGNGIQWYRAQKMPASKFQPDMGDWVWAYKKETTFFLSGIITAKNNQTIQDTITVDALICENACIPVTKNISFTLLISKQKALFKSFAKDQKLADAYAQAQDMPLDQRLNSESLKLELGTSVLPSLTVEQENDVAKDIAWDYDPIENKYELNLLLAIILAFLAGIILNVMPCVLPVLGIKILAFSKSAEGTKKNAIISSLFFATGMITIFIALASLAAFARLSWGEQFQDPKTLAAIICIIFVFALGMFDVFMILVPSSIASVEQKTKGRFEWFNDFIKGMFTTILATPCSGPLLGATLAWTLTKSPPVIYTIFIAIGLGMASPYILLSSSSRILKLVPKPGKWMDDFKHIMGFLLFGFAVYLMIGLPKDMIIPTVGLCIFLALSIMVYQRFTPFGSSIKRKLSSGLSALLVVLLGIHVNFNLLYNFISLDAAEKSAQNAIAWESLTPAKLIDAHSQGQHVIIDFTANWCMNCQFNKIRVYHSQEVNDLIKKKNILALKADITQENPPAESLLHHLGSRSVPFFAVFPGDDPYHPIILRDIVSKKQVIKILTELEEKK